MNRIFLFLCFILISVHSSYSNELTENYEKHMYIHQRLHYASEVYVVRYDNVIKDTWAHGAADRLNISTSITNVIKGNKKIGDSISFYRIFEGRIKDTSTMINRQYIVFIDKRGNDLVIDPQDPSAVIYANCERVKYLLKHESEAD